MFSGWLARVNCRLVCATLCAPDLQRILRRTAWQTKKSQHSVRIRCALVRRNPTANTAARLAKAPARLSNLIVIAGTTGARAISRRRESFLKKKGGVPASLSFFQLFKLAISRAARQQLRRAHSPVSGSIRNTSQATRNSAVYGFCFFGEGNGSGSGPLASVIVTRLRKRRKSV